jgi:TPR repeat protein
MGLFDRLKKVIAAAAEVKENPAPASMSEEQRLTLKANGGDVAAMIELAERCKFGTAEEGENGEKAVYWYTKAAEQGDTTAQFSLGYFYEYGDGIEPDGAKAIYWYTQAAEQGDSSAQFSLASAYELGEIVTQDIEKAIYWFTKAAEQGDEDAKIALENLLEE